MIKQSTQQMMAIEAATTTQPLLGGPAANKNHKRRQKAKNKPTNAEILARLGANPQMRHQISVPKSPRAANNNKRINASKRKTKAFFGEEPKGSVPSSEMVVNAAAAAVLAAPPVVVAVALNVKGSVESTTKAGEPALPINKDNNDKEQAEAVEGQAKESQAVESQEQEALSQPEPTVLNNNAEAVKEAAPVEAPIESKPDAPIAVEGQGEQAEPAQQGEAPEEEQAIEAAAVGPKDAEGLLLAASGAGVTLDEEGKEADGEEEEEEMHVHDIDVDLEKPIPTNPLAITSGAAMLCNAVAQTVQPIAKGLYAAGARISATLRAVAGAVAAGACRVGKAIRALGARIAAFVRSVVARVADAMA